MNQQITVQLGGQPVQIVVGENTLLARSAADRAEASATESEQSADIAKAAVNYYPTAADGEAATVVDELFSYSSGNVIVLAKRTAIGHDVLESAATVRADLASTASDKGASLISKSQANLADILPITPQEYGALGDGSDDTTSFTAAKDATAGPSWQIGGKMSLIPGDLYVSGSATAQFWTMEGAGPQASRINHAGTGVDYLFTNGGFGYATWDKFSVRNFAGFLKSTAQVESFFSTGLYIIGNSSFAFDVSANFLVGNVINLTIDGSSLDGAGGIKVNGSFNNNSFLFPQWLNLKQPVLRSFNLSEGTMFINSRVEGTENAEAAFSFSAGSRQHILDLGGYMEGAHEYYVRGFTGAYEDVPVAATWEGSGQLIIGGKHFTGRSNGQYKFDTTVPILTFGNYFVAETRLPPQNQALGYQHGLVRSEYVSAVPFVSRKRRPTAISGTGPWTQDVMVLARPTADNLPVNQGIMTGELIYTAEWSAADGSLTGATARRFNVTVHGRAGENLSLTVAAVGTDVNAGNASTALAISASGATTPTSCTVIATWTDVDPATIVNFDQQWSFTWNQCAGVAANTFAVSEPGGA